MCIYMYINVNIVCVCVKRCSSDWFITATTNICEINGFQALAVTTSRWVLHVISRIRKTQLTNHLVIKLQGVPCKCI